jgi:thymidylate synthase (FAD)
MGYSMESQRYVNYNKKGACYIIPPKIKELPEELQFAWEEHVKCSYKLYEGLMREGKLPPEDARSLLPNCTKTEIITTASIQQWFHIFKMRADNKHAQDQIRMITQAIQCKFQELLPAVFNEM